jgi:hypothetical protein
MNQIKLLLIPSRQLCWTSVLTYLLLGTINVAWANDTSSELEQTVSSSETPPPSTNIEKEWFDQWQRNLTNSFQLQAQTIDAWFAATEQPHSEAGAYGKVRLGWEPRSGDWSNIEPRFKIGLRLPSLKNRVDILLSDDEDNYLDEALNVSRELQSQKDNTTLALRLFNPRNNKISYRVGFGRRDQVFARTTYQDYHRFSAKLNLLYEGRAYYYNRDGWGAEAGASLLFERTGTKLDRFSHRWYFEDKTNRFKWNIEAQRYYRLSTQSTFILNAYAQGYSRPNMHTEHLYLSARLRSNPLRPWLFFEIEPFVLWLKKEDFRRSYGLALRFEGFFGNNANFQF